MQRKHEDKKAERFGQLTNTDCAASPLRLKVVDLACVSLSLAVAVVDRFYVRLGLLISVTRR